MENLINKIKRDHPGLVFNAGRYHCWSPEKGLVLYADDDHVHAVEGLLHELGHARLDHERYTSDLELLRKEVDAWHEAQCLAKMYDVDFDEDHMQDCLDTYRDWIHKRSTCPRCTSAGVQENNVRYNCLNCNHQWAVSASRLCRPYRRSTTKNQIA